MNGCAVKHCGPCGLENVLFTGVDLDLHPLVEHTPVSNELRFGSFPPPGYWVKAYVDPRR